MSRATPRAVLEHMHQQLGLTKQTLMDSTLVECIESSQRFFVGDYSGFPDPDPGREKRIELFEGMHAGCSTGVQLKARFLDDPEKLKRILMTIKVIA